MERKWLGSLVILVLLFSSSSELLASTVTAQGGGDASTLMGSGFMWPEPSGTQIDTWDGSLTLSRTEAELPSRVPILIAFTYFSRLHDVFSQYGYGWRFNHNIYYVDNENETIIVWGNGGAATFEKDKGSGGYINTPGVTDTLQEYAPNQFLLTTKDGFRFYFGNPAHQHVTQVADRFGNQILFTYDRFNLLTKISDDHSVFNVYFYYDDDGMLKRVQLPNRDITFNYSNQNLITINTLNSTTFETVYQSNYSYDAQHYLTNIYDPSDRTVTVEYSDSRVSHITSPLTDTQVAYDTVEGKTTIVERTDNIAQTTTLFFDSQGRCQRIQDDQGDSVFYEWDGNNIVSITDQNGGVTGYEYDANRNPVAITDATRNVTRYTYREGSNDPTSYTDARGYSWNYSYSPSGELTQKTDPTGNSTLYSYDLNGDQTEIDYPVGNVKFEYNEFGQVTRKLDSTGYYLNYSYEVAGNLVKVTDPVGNNITYQYDLMNRIVSTTDRMDRTTEYFYDAYNNLVERIDPGNRVTLFEYDALDRVTKVTDALGNVTTYNYNAGGYTKTFTDPRGNTTIFTYDSLNRLISEQDPLGNSSSYTYDAVDNMLSYTDQNGNITYYSYDALNRLVAVDYPGGNKAYYSYDQIGNVVRLSDSHATLNYTYDALSRLTEVKDLTHGKTVSYSYDAMGNVKKQMDPFGKTTNYAYDDVGRLTSVVDPDGGTTELYYQVNGWLAEKHYSNGIVAFYGYDPDGQLTYLRYQNSTGQTMSTYTCMSDEVGNIINTNLDGKVTLFSYDLLNRLVGVTYPNASTVEYAYDACGNRISSTSPSGTVNYLYDAANRLVQAGAMTYEWDKNGNLVAKNSADGKTTYQYDSANKLVSIGYPDSTTTSYVYYPDGRLMNKTVGTAQTCYIYSGDNVLYETDGDWNPTIEYNVVGIDDILSIKVGGDYYFYLYDYVGSVVAVVNNSEQLVSTCSYDPFGVPSVSGSFANSHLFIDREYDSKSQLYNFRARYYDPFTGRFISKDPVPNYVEPYTYVSNNPLTLVDPSGLMEKRNLESTADLAPMVNTPTSMQQRRDLWENLAQEGLMDPCGYAGYWKYTVGKWESGLISEMDWLKKNWKNILYAVLGISGSGVGATGLGLQTGVLGLHGNEAEPFYLCWESTYRAGGAGGFHLGINKTYMKSDWIFHVGVPEHVAETPFGQAWTKIFGPGKAIKGTAHYFPLKGAWRAAPKVGAAVLLAGFFAAPIIGLKGCDRQKEPDVERLPNAVYDLTDTWTYLMHEHFDRPDQVGSRTWDEHYNSGSIWIRQEGLHDIVDGQGFGQVSWYTYNDSGLLGYTGWSFSFDFINGTISGNSLTLYYWNWLPLGPGGSWIWYSQGSDVLLLNRWGTYGVGHFYVSRYGGNWPYPYYYNTTEIRVDTSVSVDSVPNRIEPRYGPYTDVTVVLNDHKTGDPSDLGGPLTFQNYSPELATLSNYVDLGPQAKIRVNLNPSFLMRANAPSPAPLGDPFPSGEITIGVKSSLTPMIEQNFTITVSPTSTWTVGKEPYMHADFSTIQEAINAAAPGDTIDVLAGTYPENIVINKPLLLIGDQYNNPYDRRTIRGLGAGNVITVTADNVAIDGFQVVNCSSAYPTSGIFLDNVTNALITKNIVFNNDGFGIFDMWGSNNTITENQVYNNSRAGVRVDGPYSNSSVTYNSMYDNHEDGLFLYNTSDVLVDGNGFYHNSQCGATLQGDSQNITLTDNTFSWNGLDGLYVVFCTNITVNSSWFISDGQFGLLLDTSYNNTIQNNEFMTEGPMTDMGVPSGDGIYVWNSTGNNVAGNIVVDDWRYEAGRPIVYLENENGKSVTDAGQVILVNCTGITINGLNATSVDVGLELWLTNGTTVTNSTFKGNLIGIMAYNSSNNKVYHCDFINNSWYSVFIPTAGFSNVWDNGFPSGGNYWSDYAGVDANLDGIGDTPYTVNSDNVDRFPLMNLGGVRVVHSVYLLLNTEPLATYARGQPVTFKVTVFNQQNPQLEATLTLTITGPGGYSFYDFQSINVSANGIGEYSFDWVVPDANGTYIVETSLVPAMLTAYDAKWLQIGELSSGFADSSAHNIAILTSLVIEVFALLALFVSQTMQALGYFCSLLLFKHREKNLRTVSRALRLHWRFHRPLRMMLHG